MADDSEYQAAEIPADLKPLESRLGSLTPVAGRLDRDRVMYLAGAAAATSPPDAPVQQAMSIVAVQRRSLRFQDRLWPLATAALALVSLGLAARLASEGHRMPTVEPPLTAGANPTSARSVDAPNTGRDNQSMARMESSGASGISGNDRGNYLALREQVLRLGVDSLDRPAAPSSADASPDVDVRNRVLLNQLLGG